MKKIICLLIVVVVISCGCGSKKSIPDVSNIKIDLQVERFEKDFFLVDTLHLNHSLDSLNKKHPGFTQDFIFNIMGTTIDSASKDVPSFIRSYADMYKTSLRKFSPFDKTVEEVKQGLRFVHYYFPKYSLPKKLITFIGPINGYSNIITTDAMAVGLQTYMGNDYPLYLSEEGQQLYPLFISRRFEPAYIPVNSIRNIIDDMFPYKNNGMPLIEQMVESGKRIYLMDRLLPLLPDTLKIGYTAKQLEGCYESEKNIWSFFVQNDLIYSTDQNLTRDYLNDGPNTPVLGDNSPGNIGQFVGWQIVNKWMDQHKNLTLDELMHTNAKKIFEEAKYKPK
jgi:hypothetical protein